MWARYFPDNRLISLFTSIFFLASILVHATFFLLLTTMDIKKEIKREPFFARIVSPEDISGRPFHPLNRRSTRVIPEDKVIRDKGLKGDLPSIKDAPQEIPDNARNTGNDVYHGIRLPDSPIKRNPPSRNERARLFDPDVIMESGKDVNIKNIERGSSDITFDVKEFRYHGYLTRLKEKIESIWIYPRSAAEKGIFGDLYIRFTINKNGKLGNVELIRTSGYRELDEAAIKALKDGEPYWPLPDEWGVEHFTITGHFIYTIYGYYVR